MTTRYRIEAIDNWPREDSRPRRYAQFRMTFDKSLALLRKEAEMLGVTEDEPLVLRLVCEPRHVRKDGMLRQDAWIGHPGVILSVTTVEGDRLEFATDRYEAWRDNVHAIGLSLEALRGVDRWGVTHGAQYAGFKALPAGTGHSFAGVMAACDWMRQRASRMNIPLKSESTGWGGLYREMAKQLHPDAGGDPDDWAKLQNARTLLAAGGLL